MKPFKFTLDKVYEYKTQILDTEKNKLALLQKERDTLIEQLEKAQMDKQLHQEEFQKKQVVGVNGVEISSYKYILDNITNQIEALNKFLATAEEKVAIQLKVVTRSSQEVSGYEKLEEKQHDRHFKLEKRETENDILEFVTLSQASSHR